MSCVSILQVPGSPPEATRDQSPPASCTACEVHRACDDRGTPARCQRPCTDQNGHRSPRHIAECKRQPRCGESDHGGHDEAKGQERGGKRSKGSKAPGDPHELCFLAAVAEVLATDSKPFGAGSIPACDRRVDEYGSAACTPSRVEVCVFDGSDWKRSYSFGGGR